MNKEALLIIDVQLAMFMCDGGVYKGEETLDNIKTLLERAREKAIEKLTIVGMQTEFCVDTTIRAAFSKEYKNTFVRGCHTTFDTEVLKAEDIIKHHERTWGSFGELKNLEDITF